MDCVSFLTNEGKESKARKILEHTKTLITEASSSSVDDWFYMNRFVYARLQLDERHKKPRKTALFHGGLRCCICKGEINKGELKDTDIHRLNQEKWYLEKGNAVLVHRACHQQPNK